jgi:hypothetical protein
MEATDGTDGTDGGSHRGPASAPASPFDRCHPCHPWPPPSGAAAVMDLAERHRGRRAMRNARPRTVFGVLGEKPDGVRTVRRRSRAPCSSDFPPPPGETIAPGFREAVHTLSGRWRPPMAQTAQMGEATEAPPATPRPVPIRAIRAIRAIRGSPLLVRREGVGPHFGVAGRPERAPSCLP